MEGCAISSPLLLPPAIPLHAPGPPPNPPPCPRPLLRVWLQDGWTPLHEAAADGHLTVVQALLEAGARLEAMSKVRGDVRGWGDGDRPLRIRPCLDLLRLWGLSNRVGFERGGGRGHSRMGVIFSG